MIDQISQGNTARIAEMIQNRAMNRFDSDGSGDISLEEAGDRGPLARDFAQIDANEDGILSQDELAESIQSRIEQGGGPMGPERMNAMAGMMRMQDSSQALFAMFDKLDTDEDGSLSENELSAAMEALPLSNKGGAGAALSMIETLFEDMLAANEARVDANRLATMSRSLYAEAQEILMNQLEQAADLTGETGDQDDDQAEYA